MSQLSLLILELILCLLFLLIMYKKYGTTGLYCYTVIALILSNIMSLKIINIFDYDINLGITPFVTIFTAFNILIQKKGADETKKLFLVTIAYSIISYILLFLISFMSPSDINRYMSASYDNIFNGSIRISFATMVTTIYSLLLNMNLYQYLKKMKNNILISNIFSTIIIHFVSSILFGIIANIFTKEPLDIIKIIMIRYLICLFIGIISTIIIYISKYINTKE